MLYRMSNIKSHLDVVVFDTLPEKVSYEIFKDFFYQSQSNTIRFFWFFFFYMFLFFQKRSDRRFKNCLHFFCDWFAGESANTLPDQGHFTCLHRYSSLLCNQMVMVVSPGYQRWLRSWLWRRHDHWWKPAVHWRDEWRHPAGPGPIGHRSGRGRWKEGGSAGEFTAGSCGQSSLTHGSGRVLLFLKWVPLLFFYMHAVGI